MAFDDPENPKIMEDFIRAIGAEPVIYSQRNECCGGYQTLNDKEIAKSRSEAVVSSAVNKGAEANAVTELPVIYFTELLAEALGVKEVQ